MKDLLPSISKFTKLQVLHIVSSPIELDSLFNTLGANCPDLRYILYTNCCVFRTYEQNDYFFQSAATISAGNEGMLR
jgi:hypothetical protein